MRINAIVTTALLALLLSSPANADEAKNSKVMSASDAFDFFQQVDGEWKAETVTVPVGTPKEKGESNESVIAYESVANGST